MTTTPAPAALDACLDACLAARDAAHTAHEDAQEYAADARHADTPSAARQAADQARVAMYAARLHASLAKAYATQVAILADGSPAARAAVGNAARAEDNADTSYYLAADSWKDARDCAAERRDDN